MDITDENKKFMAEAIKLSEQSVKSGGGPFGAVIVLNGEIIARGTNQVVTHNDPTAHAEMVAIRRACETLESFQLDECAIYTSSEPCPMCFGAIYWARPEVVYYANSKEDSAKVKFDDTLIYKEINIPDEKREIPFHQLLPKDAKDAFKMWKDKKDKIEY